jgi:hypothetical protein
MYETGSGAVSRYSAGRRHILVQVQDLNWVQLRVSGYKFHDKVNKRDGAVCKNRDKQLTFIVRVMCWHLFLTFILTASYQRISYKMRYDFFNYA